MGVGSRLKTIRKDMKMTQTEFAKFMSLSFRTISNYETELSPIAQDLLIKLLERGYSIPWLLTGEGSMKMSDMRPEGAMPFKFEGKIPLIGTTAAGIGSVFNDNDIPKLNEATEFIPRPMNIKDPLAYALRISTINGDSMYPSFKPHEVLIVSPVAPVFNNDKVIVKLKDGQVMFKIYKCKEDHIELHSVNPAYKPVVITSRDLALMHKVMGSLEL